MRDSDGHEVGMVELDFREPRECELAFVGLVPELSGKGHGSGCSPKPFAVPGARASSGSMSTPARSTIRPRCPPTAAPASRPYKRAVERFPDPRLLGVLPKDCAPQIPLLGT